MWRVFSTEHNFSLKERRLPRKPLAESPAVSKTKPRSGFPVSGLHFLFLLYSSGKVFLSSPFTVKVDPLGISLDSHSSSPQHLRLEFQKVSVFLYSKMFEMNGLKKCEDICNFEDPSPNICLHTYGNYKSLCSTYITYNAGNIIKQIV